MLDFSLVVGLALTVCHSVSFPEDATTHQDLDLVSRKWQDLIYRYRLRLTLRSESKGMEWIANFGI